MNRTAAFLSCGLRCAGTFVAATAFAVGLAHAVETDIAISTTAVDFGNVPVGESAMVTVTLTNTGGDPFGPINMFGGAPPTPEFNASQNCQASTLPSGGSCTVNYVFTPSSTGTFEDLSRFTVSETNAQQDGEDFTVVLTGVGGPVIMATATATTLSCTPNPSAPARTVNCTARVTAAGNVATPGSVAFSVNGNTVDTDAVDDNGRARFATSSLPLGTHEIVARYTPSAPNLLPSTSTPLSLSVITPIATLTAVEYFHAGFGHYFVTAFPAEIALLDGGAFGGAWQRTGRTFPVWESADPGTFPVCRFFSASFAPKSSHFYTPFQDECETVKANPAWQFEGVAFHLKLPSSIGTCPLGSAPLHRLYNNGLGGAPNHRYTTSANIVIQMVALGWVPEGFGGAVVSACIPDL